MIASHISSIFERFCYNDVDETCTSYFNCTPCHLTLKDPSCNRIQYVEELGCKADSGDVLIPKLQIKTEEELYNCSKLRSQCQEDFEQCLHPFFNCMDNCTRDLTNETLSRYDGYEGIILDFCFETLFCV